MKTYKRQSFKPRVIDLESRCLLSAAPQFSVKDLGVVLDVRGLNNLGQVVGMTAGPVRHAFLSDPNGGQIHIVGNFPNDQLSIATAVNDRGQVTGYSWPYVDQQGNEYPDFHGFVSSNNGGSLTSLGSNLYPGAINSSGTVVGENGTQDLRAFIANSNGTFNLIPTANNTSYAIGINDSGQVVGFIESAHGGDAFVTDSTETSIVDIGLLSNQQYSVANSINNLGQVVGSAGGQPFLYSSSSGFVDLFSKYSSASGSAYDINNNGEIVGECNGHAFAYISGTMYYDLNNLISSGSGLTLNDAVGVNDHGQIAVRATDATGAIHALLLTPVPQAPTITWTTPAPIVYGTPLSATQLNATADVPGTFSYVLPPYNPAQGVILPAGQTTVTAVFRPTDSVDYASATFIQTITVTPAPLTITTNNATMVQGAPLPALTGTITGLVNGDHDAFVFTTNATSASPAGSYVISPTPAPNPGLDYNNYAISFHTGVLTVLPAPAVSVQSGILIIDDTAAPAGMPTTTISLDAAGQNYVVNTGGSIQTVAKSAVYNNYVQFKGSLLGHDSVNAATLPTTVLFATMGYGDGNVFTGCLGLNYIMWMSGLGNTEIDNGGRVYTFNYTGGTVTKIGNATWYN